MRRTTRQVIAATPADLKNNRLGLMSQEQLETLRSQIELFEPRMAQVIRRGVAMATLITVAVVLLSFARVIFLPTALAIEVVVVGVLLYMTTDCNRFARQLTLDQEAEAVAHRQRQDEPRHAATAYSLSHAAY